MKRLLLVGLLLAGALAAPGVHAQTGFGPRPDVPMSRGTLAAVQDYPWTIRAMQKAPTAEHVCAVLAAAESLEARFTKELTPALAKAAEPDRRRMARSVHRMVVQLTGLVDLDPQGDRDTFAMAIDYRAIAVMLANTHPDRPLLLATAAIVGTNGWPGYIRQQTDEAGCFDPGAVHEPLEQLPAAWRQADACVQAHVRGPLRDAFEAMASHTNYCQGPTAAKASVRAIAELLRRLPELDGPPYADRMEAQVNSKAARFNFTGG